MCILHSAFTFYNKNPYPTMLLLLLIRNKRNDKVVVPPNDMAESPRLGSRVGMDVVGMSVGRGEGAVGKKPLTA